MATFTDSRVNHRVGDVDYLLNKYDNGAGLRARVVELAEKYCPGCNHEDDGEVCCFWCNGLHKLAEADKAETMGKEGKHNGLG